MVLFWIALWIPAGRNQLSSFSTNYPLTGVFSGDDNGFKLDRDSDPAVYTEHDDVGVKGVHL